MEVASRHCGATRKTPRHLREPKQTMPVYVRHTLACFGPLRCAGSRTAALAAPTRDGAVLRNFEMHGSHGRKRFERHVAVLKLLAKRLQVRCTHRRAATPPFVPCALKYHMHFCENYRLLAQHDAPRQGKCCANGGGGYKRCSRMSSTRSRVLGY